MTLLDRIILISIVAVILAFSFDALACEEPTSDADLAKYYYICQGGFCLRDSGQ